MSLRCSLLGHSYGEAEIEREREEQGSEVVVTVREFEECERCGDRKTITENKEVTAIQSPAPDLETAESDSGMASRSGATSESGETGATAGSAAGQAGGTEATGGASGDSTAGTGTPTATDAEVTAAAGGDDAEIIGGSTDSGESAAESSGSSGSDASASESAANAETDAAETAPDSAGPGGSDFEEEPSAADDDGVILDDEGDADESDDRTPGEWPDAETTHPAETDDGPGEWPAVGREDSDEGYDAEPGDAGDADVQFGGGLTPESAPEVDDDETDEVEFVNAEGDALQSKDAASSTTELSSGISAGAEAPSMSGPADDPDVDAQFVCPECDYRQDVAGSSLRAGDICPECARGYLAQE
ncbi:hypothetical protein M0R88_09575 [Halorussus gelatinilyticus]|uniref:Uncharacterized protein n=1 Tax=Halorussus gelatinilyticus TaxID=2937524 RepID=A0A8U0IF14_9EURY|nr:hypothetical protein [Halorussus gelatinilyticus]UPV98781.1 hypothetical protein M0R88_09575 [Halorussus gelatinilyticus]